MSFENSSRTRYNEDKKVANVCEKEVAYLICSYQNCRLVEVSKDNRYDLKFKKDDNFVTVEVKEDFTCERTGNVGLEYSCRGKDSGISVSKSDYYCYKLHEPSGEINFYLIETNMLKRLITDEKYHNKVNGGDLNSNSLSYLFRLSLIKAFATKIDKNMKSIWG